MWDPQSIAFSWFIFVAEKTMVYGRYNDITIVNGDYFTKYSYIYHKPLFINQLIVIN